MKLSDKELARAQPTEIFHHLPDHRKVLHIGGHLGLEARFYNNVTFVEPIPKYAEFLRGQGFEVIEGAVCGDRLYITAYDQASSVLKPQKHQVVECITVKNLTLDGVNDGSFDLLVMDTQGSELMILKSGRLTFRFVIVEASNKPRYESAGSKREIESYLFSKGYSKIKEFQHKPHDIYDLLFEKRTST